jgi:hypothetical protein
MIENPESLKEVIEDLNNKNEPKLARQLLDYYYTRCQTILDYDTLGFLALKHNYAELSVKTAEAAYAMAKTKHELYISRTNLYKAYSMANMPEKALFYININLQEDPTDFDTISYLGATLKLNGEKEKGQELIDDLIQNGNLTEEQYKKIRSTQANKYFMKGEIGKGIDHFLGVKKDKATVFQLMGMQRWDGIPIPGKKLYIYDCGGIGDTFINIRFLEHIKQLGMEPVMYSNLDRTDVLEVLYRNGFNVTSLLDGIDITCPHTELMTLPVDMDLNENQLWNGSYLKPLMQTKNNLGVKKKFRIGLKCSGNPYFAQDLYRSIPIDQMMDIMPEDVEVYYIDKDQEFPQTINLKDRINNWEDTIDYINQMDLIISSCTSLPHVSGAMGIPTIVIPPISEYYIWITNREDNKSHWYGDNFRVFKQEKARSWKEPLEKARLHILEIMKEPDNAN